MIVTTLIRWALTWHKLFFFFHYHCWPHFHSGFFELNCGRWFQAWFFFFLRDSHRWGYATYFLFFIETKIKKIKLKLTIGLPRWVLLPFYTLLPFTLILIWFYYCRSSDWKFDSRRLKVISISDYSVILLEKKNTQAKEGVSL